jgi:endonuclease-3
MAKKLSSAERGRQIDRMLAGAYRDAVCSLDFRNPLQLLVATILSAQCTDERVNKVTKTLFEQYKTAKAFADAEPAELEDSVRSTGFFRNKAKNIRNCCRIISEQHYGRVPESMEELLALPGVARKTANVILGTAFDKAEGVVVDTHVKRIAGRLGLSEEQDPVKIERDLMEAIPRKSWIAFAHRMIAHGRAVCHARKPICDKCPLLEECPSAAKFM